MLDSLCLFTLFPAFRRILFAHDSESSSPVKTMPTTRGQAKRHATTAEPATATSSSAEKTTKTARASSSALATATPRKRGRPPKHPKTTLAETATPGDDKMSAVYDDEERVPLLVGEEPPMVARSWAQRNQWIVFALASGACAAFNGVFAKLTTTELTSTLSLAIARLLGLEKAEKVVEIAVRGMFFGLNLVFNGVMWTLFTKALAKGNSTTQVTIMNTSFNFFITAILGFAIFSEALPPLWWLGAAMLVAGNVIVGAKEESSKENVEGGAQDTGSISLSLADDEIVNLRASEAVKDDGDDEDVLQDLIVEDEE